GACGADPSPVRGAGSAPRHACRRGMKASPAALKSWRLAALGAMGDPAARPAFALTIAVATFASGWAIAFLSPSLALAVIGGVVGLTLWLQAPELGVYAL